MVVTHSTAPRWSPAWIIEPTESPPAKATELVLSAGTDRRVAIDGLDPASQAAARRWQAGEPAVATDPVQRTLLDRLVAVGAMMPALASEPSLVLVGDPDVTAELAELMGSSASEPVGGDLRVRASASEPAGGDLRVRASASEPVGGDLVVAVRTGAAWPSVPDGCVHLGLDIALHHTIVLGPLVLPGASACLGCLDARMAHQWPAPSVPPRPAVQRCLAVAAALLRVQAELVASGASPLVNATIAWDLERGTTDRQALYKQPGCVRCDTGGAIGRVALPWEAT